MFKWCKFSKKQRMLFNWWVPDSPVKDSNGIIADGSIRAGKTVAMALSFIMWATYSYNHENFIMAGKTIKSFGRNVLAPLKNILPARGFTFTYKSADNLLDTVKRLSADL